MDIIKLVISGDSFVPHAGSETTIMSEAEVAAAAEVAHAHGKRLSAHARSAESVKLCVRHGIKVIYHANYADEEALDLLEANKDWLFISPNIGFTAIAAYEGSEWFTEEQVQTMGFRDELDSAVSGIQALMKRGVRILGGGDYGFMITPHGRNARDLDHFIKHCGMTAMESILTMTKNGGEAMDMPDRLGQIREGFLADLLLVDGNPLADTKVLLRRENLRLIMKDGKFIAFKPKIIYSLFRFQKNRMLAIIKAKNKQIKVGVKYSSSSPIRREPIKRIILKFSTKPLAISGFGRFSSTR